MGWSTDDIPDQSGRVAVVTGANGGLGLETARALAGAGATVVMAVRNAPKAEAAEADIRTGVPEARLERIHLDLTSLDSVRAAAREIAEAHPRVDLLVNNAGIMGIPRRLTADGFEAQLGVNHLGHWVLTSRLLPQLLRADAARVVSVTSTAHHFGRALDPDDPAMERGYGPWKAYFRSKLANYHFALGLQRDLEAAGAPAISVLAHPGLTNTELQAASVEAEGGFLSRFFHRYAILTGMTPEQGALPQLRAATDPEASGGDLYAPRFVNNGPPVRRPVLRRVGLGTAIDRLWTVSARETGETIDVPAALAAARR